MTNIELKITLDSFDEIMTRLKKIGATEKGELHQIDTYYNSKRGRLKIREINKRYFELIYYERADTSGSKQSDYSVLKIKLEELETMKFILKNSLGEKVRVEKKRFLWLYKNTRIHLDKVKKLGKFLELETVVKKITSKQAKNEHEEVIKLLNLSKYKKMSVSYSDLIFRSK
jgi:predicted adenylyl cyclase CyaB